MLTLPMPLLTIEYHPENGQLPWMVVLASGPQVWCAFEHQEQACERLTDPKYIALYEKFAREVQWRS